MSSTKAMSSTKKAASKSEIIAKIEKRQKKSTVPHFRVGDSVRVHAKIVEGNKERIQIFEGIVIKRHKGTQLSASFTVRKVSYNVGVERTFLLHSPRIEKIEVTSRGSVRRARLYYLRPLRGKASRIKSQVLNSEDQVDIDTGDGLIDDETPDTESHSKEAAAPEAAVSEATA